ncbi:hypothetical protein [Pseudomonas aeruginosa]
MRALAGLLCGLLGLVLRKRGNLKVRHGGAYWMNGCGTAPGSAGGTEAPWAEEEAWVGATLEKPTGTRLPSLSVSTTWSSEILRKRGNLKVRHGGAY